MYSESLHHLEDIHNSFSLTAINDGGNGTVHTRPGSSVTVNIIMSSSIDTTHSPAVYDNGPVSSSPLNFRDLFIDVSDSLEVGTLSISVPVQQVELGHLMSLFILCMKTIHQPLFYNSQTSRTFLLSTLSCLIVNPGNDSSPRLSIVNSPNEVTLPLSGQY